MMVMIVLMVMIVMMVMIVLLLEFFWTIVVHSPFFTDAACFMWKSKFFDGEIPISRWWTPHFGWLYTYIYIYLSISISNIYIYIYIYVYENHVSCVSSIFLVISDHFRHPLVARPSWRSSSATRSEPGARPWTWTDPWTSNARSSSRRARFLEMWRWV